MNKKIFSLFTIFVSCVLPLAVLAADGFQPGNTPFAVEGFSFNVIIQNIFHFIWVLLIVFAIVMFIVAGFQFLAAQGEPEAIKKARNSLIWGVAGVVVAIVAFSVPLIIYNAFIPPPQNPAP